jgi:hypothetical protein
MQTNTALTLAETIRAEATEVIEVIQHTTAQIGARSLSVHPQVEPDGFRSLTTRVRRHVLDHASLTHTLLGRRRLLLYPITCDDFHTTPTCARASQSGNTHVSSTLPLLFHGPHCCTNTRTEPPPS